MKRLLDRIPRRVIMGCETPGPYLTRYFLLRTRLLNIYLHQFHRSDEGRDLHDHPWAFVSVILRGGYWEWRPTEKHEYASDVQVQERHWKPVGSVLFRPAKTAHRVEVDPARLPWSLVFCGPRIRTWGFYTQSGWKEWKAYLRGLGCLEMEGESGND